ncbi:MAG: cobaltochelatase subunit CobN, partial [Bacteroidales bacterium]|nr:cobaltochelatase subunit CobN [Bacteroidales bacterium]
MKKKAIYWSAGALAIALGLCCLYMRYAAKTNVATLNFPDFTVEKMRRANDNAFVRIVPVDLDKAERIKRYDMVLVRVHGSSLDQRHLDAIKAAIGKGVPVFSTESQNAEINSLDSAARTYVASLMNNGSVRNYRSLFNFIRREVDRKVVFNKPYEDVVPVPADYYFHLGEDEFFATYEAYQRFYEDKGLYKAGEPRVVLLSGNINMQNSNEEHMAALVRSLEEKGLNVYPVFSFGAKKLDMISAVRPDVIINRPHGRMLMGGGERGTDSLEVWGVPVLSPVTVSDLYENWVDSPQGLSGGSGSAMSVVLPELDGAIAPYAVAAQFERNGMKIFDAIPGHTEKFCRLVKHYADLRSLPNSEKKVAIYYYKGVGKGAVNASGLEGVPSLYNTLKLLQANGYDVSGLPDNAVELERRIAESGVVLGPYAAGAYDRFLKTGHPAEVTETDFMRWMREDCPPALADSLRTRYGAFPGDYMGIDKADGGKAVAVARLRFGNIVILPQPMASVGEDVDKIVHGGGAVPAYPYVASYLWTRKAFGANAILHFGTHGSLEFIPGKQLALSDYDWTDALIGDVPHFYIYTISNIGEGIIAKRRSYATLLSHLTAPFMQSGLYPDLFRLRDEIHRMENLEESDLKKNYLTSITDLARKAGVLSALSIDTGRTLTVEEVERIHHYVEEVEDAKVSDGLYILGRPYTSEQVRNTVRLMATDAVSYALAGLDAAHGRIQPAQAEDGTCVNSRYGARADRIIGRLFDGERPEAVLRSLISAEDASILADMAERQARRAEKAARRAEAMREAMEAGPEAAAGMMQRMAQAQSLDEKPAGRDPERPSKERGAGHPAAMPQEEPGRNAALEEALSALLAALLQTADMKRNVQMSTQSEQQALLAALSGRYVAPGSAGDPIINPSAVPTGKNFYSVNPETTPTAQAWKVGKQLAEELLATEKARRGHYPEKVSFTLWATDFVSTEGAMVAQIFYLLGVEPLRDGFGNIRSLRLIPVEELGRPRVDVVVQTSGQLRDIAASRLALINKAVAMAAEDGAAGENFVRSGRQDAERYLLEKGYSPADARKYAGERIFGGVNGNYGTAIMGMGEKGDSWDSVSDIAERYIANMSGLYSADGAAAWGEAREHVFEAALLNTEVVVQPRSSNTWGPLSLDHVYEFMGGMSAAVTHVTGTEPTAYFSDFRNRSRARVQELKEAIGVESGSTVLNPKYIAHMLQGESSALSTFAETVRNTYGWNAMRASAIDEHLWDQYYEIYVEDRYDLGVEKRFSEKNPYALQEVTAVMMESARKGMWDADESQMKAVAELHGRLVEEHTAACSGFVCDNAALKRFIASKLDAPAAERYQEKINEALRPAIENADKEGTRVLEKEETP